MIPTSSVLRGWRSNGGLLADLLRMMLRHPWLTVGTVGPSILMPAIEPAQAWFLKVVIDRLQSDRGVVVRTTLISWIPSVVGVCLLLLGLRYLQRITNRVFDERLLIDMQRRWFDSRGLHGSNETVARVMNDCDKARRFLDLFQRDIWVFGVSMISVAFWQLKVNSGWVPALLVATAPIPVLAAFVTRRVAVLTRVWLEGIVGVVQQSHDGDREGLHCAQEIVYRGKIRCERWKAVNEAVAESGSWIGITLILCSSVLLALPIMPDHIRAGDLAMFWVNLGLICRQLLELAKFSNKAAEAWPAVVRVLRPGWEGTLVAAPTSL